MSYVIVIAVALLVSALTLFSGFGLGTLLMPVFALFFPLEIAIAATAVVHLANNIFKLFLVGAWANARMVLRFAVPAAVAAVGGALVLNEIQGIEPLFVYDLGSRRCSITTVKLIVAVIIGSFTVIELLPGFKKVAFSERLVPLGGVLSGFFGGLSGHQGALRTAFLVRAGMEKKAFLGTVVVAAVVVDVSRLCVYGLTYFGKSFGVLRSEGEVKLVVVATLAAFVGSFVGARLVKKITMESIHSIVAVMLLLVAIALGSGII